MAYTWRAPAFRYIQPDISQPADPYSKLMAYYQNYGYGPEQQFFTWGRSYDPTKWEGDAAGLAQAGQQQAQAPQQQRVPDSLIRWWTGGGSDMFNSNMFNTYRK